MKGHEARLKAPLLVFFGLLLGGQNLLAQAAPPVATALRAYCQGFREPVRLATDTGGNLYVADSRAGLISVRDESGKLLMVKRGLARPLGVAVDASGRIFVGEAAKGRVSVFMPGWVSAGALGQGDGEFKLPNHILVGPDGLVYVVDSAANLVKVYGSNGLLIRKFGGAGAQPGQFDFPTGIAITPAGELVVSDVGNERIQVFDGNGGFLRAFGNRTAEGTNSTFGRVQGILADHQGRIYLADSFRGVVTVVTATGATLGTIGAFGANQGQLTGPASLALDTHNRLFVATPSNNRVEVYGLDTFTDPHILSANLTGLSRQWSRDEASGRAPGQAVAATAKAKATSAAQNLLSVLIKVPGVSPASLQGDSITANGIPAMPMPGPCVGDFDGDGQLEFRTWFDKKALLAKLPDGENCLVVAGRLADGRSFESLADVTIATLGGGAQ